MKPVNMKAWEVQAILDNRKSVTRRVVKPQNKILENPKFGYTAFTPKGYISVRGGWKDEDGKKRYGENFIKTPYRYGDILYVRETWADMADLGYNHCYKYKADQEAGMLRFAEDMKVKWHPSIHMPKEAARIFLRVTGVRVERLQDITPEQIDAEGCKEWAYSAKTGELLPSKPTWFKIKWNSAIKKKDIQLYSWDANPWAWVVEFERVSREEAE